MPMLAQQSAQTISSFFIERLVFLAFFFVLAIS